MSDNLFITNGEFLCNPKIWHRAIIRHTVEYNASMSYCCHFLLHRLCCKRKWQCALERQQPDNFQKGFSRWCPQTIALCLSLLTHFPLFAGVLVTTSSMRWYLLPIQVAQVAPLLLDGKCIHAVVRGVCCVSQHSLKHVEEMPHYTEKAR